MTNMRLATDTISNLKVDRTWTQDQSVIRDHIEQYFLNLYTEPMPFRPILLGVEFNVISDEQ